MIIGAMCEYACRLVWRAWASQRDVQELDAFFLFCEMFSINLVACVGLLHVCLVKTTLWLRIKHVRSACCLTLLWLPHMSQASLCCSFIRNGFR